MMLLGFEPEPSWFLSLMGLATLPALVLLNAFFVAAEFALVAVRRTRVEELVAQGVPGAKAVENVVAHLSRSIAATQLGITLASIALGWVSEPALARVVELLFGDWQPVTTHTIAVAIAFVLITCMHVIFGELIPKTITLQHPDRMALLLARPFQIFVTVSRPFTIIISGLANVILRLLGYEPASGTAMMHSVEELALLIEDTEEAGLIDPDQADMVQNVFHLSNKKVSDCMVPRDKMAALELNTPEDRVLEAVRAGAHTRMPVHDGPLDNIVGIVNTKNLFYLFSLRGVVVLEDALYPALYLKPDESLGNALRLFRKAKRPMAIVRDEAGKVLGVITLEDVLEEIVGDIEDEHDFPAPRVPQRRKRLAPPPKAKPRPPT
jgi:CBS domain containing-hemolysin-like protein